MNDNIADMFTKPLTIPMFNHLLGKTGMVDAGKEYRDHRNSNLSRGMCVEWRLWNSHSFHVFRLRLLPELFPTLL